MNKSTKRITGLSRGLTVLRQLNVSNGATVIELSQKTGLPRATLYRILATLMDEGYVARAGERGAFWLSADVRALSVGYSDRAWVAEIATPCLAELGREVIWPVDIATFDGDAMLIRETTYQTSPLAIDREHGARRGYPGYRVPLVNTAVGRTYLAFCEEQERDAIIDSLLIDEPALLRELGERSAFIGSLAEMRRRGYGSREGGFVPATGSIAVPVLRDSRVLAVINIHYMLSVMSIDEAVTRYLPAMRRTANQIADTLSEREVENQLAAKPR